MTREAIETLSRLRVLDVFVLGRIRCPVRISPRDPLCGELSFDASGRFFLAPDPDERGEGMGSILLLGLEPPAGYDHVGRRVAVSGVFDPTEGLRVEALTSREPASDPVPEVKPEGASSSTPAGNPATGRGERP